MTAMTDAPVQDDHADNAAAADDDFPQGMLASPTRIQL